ncbi:FHA domain-containing protein [Mariniflexile sp.]|uniref:FHA domain-containing protein n=1 Tax=Mariniflexile sp. TaxID=1979402 RepID=UPI0035651C39
MTNKDDFIELERSEFWTETGVLFCKIRNPDENINLSEETVDKHLQAVIDLCEGQKKPFLIDLRNTHGTFLTSGAKKLSSDTKLIQLCLAQAFVVDSLKVRLLIMSYKRIYEPITPFEIFNNYNDALEYVQNVKEQQKDVE